MAKYRKKPVIIDAVKVVDYINLNFKDYDGARSYHAKDGNMRFIFFRGD